MKQSNAVEQFLAGRRVLVARFVAHRHKEVQNKARKPVGVVNLYEVQCSDGKAPTVQTWCPRNVQTLEQAAKDCPCSFKEGQKLDTYTVFEDISKVTPDVTRELTISGGFLNNLASTADANPSPMSSRASNFPMCRCSSRG